MVGQTPLTVHDLFVAKRHALPGTPPAAVVAEAVRDGVIVDEARRLHLGKGVTLSKLLEQPADVATLTRRLYNYAARDVPLPADPGLRAYARAMLAVGNEGADPEDAPARIQAQYDDWLTTRDAVASAWFARLYRRYRRQTFYAARYRP
jgi:hypothetical protein